MPGAPTPATVTTAPLARRRSGGLLLFASGSHEPLARRPTDIALAILTAFVIVLVGVLHSVASDVGAAATALAESLPDFFDPLWSALVWTALGWALALVVVAAARHRMMLLASMAAGMALGGLAALGLHVLITGGSWGSAWRFMGLDGPPSFPPGAITIASAAIAVASPYLTRPFRHLGRWLIGAAVVGSMLLGALAIGGAIATAAVGLLAAAIVHLVVGSPGGRPTNSRIERALGELGVDARELQAVPMHRSGVMLFTATDDVGPLAVKVYGRDAWDAQLLATLWRLLWYRGAQRTARLSRLQLVEHEGFITLLTERAGVRAPRLVVAGSAGNGDALLVVRPDGEPVAPGTIDLPDAAVEGLWEELRQLGAAGITHSDIDFDRIVRRPDGTVGFGDFATAEVAATDAEMTRDRAQLLALTIAMLDDARAVAIARRTLGDDALAATVPYLQEAALPRGIRNVLEDQHVDLDDVRDSLSSTLGVEQQPLVKLRRVSLGSVLNLALLALAAYTMIALIGGVDLNTFIEEVRDASWPWLLWGLIIAQLARVPSAVSTVGAVRRPVPLGPLVLLQFAICYINLAIPASAARVAVNVRFLQRFGIPAAAAMSAGAIDSVSGFIVQIVLFLLVFGASGVTLSFSTDLSDSVGFLTIIVIGIVAVLVVAGIVLALKPKWRAAVLRVVHHVLDSLRVLRSPVKLAQLFLGNLASQLLFAAAFGACVHAFGQHASFADLILINTAVSLFAGLLPIPGGIGVSEAGLTLGLTAIGIDNETAFAIALAYRVASFYLPPVWGFVCYRRLIQRRYL